MAGIVSLIPVSPFRSFLVSFAQNLEKIYQISASLAPSFLSTGFIGKNVLKKLWWSFRNQSTLALKTCPKNILWKVAFKSTHKYRGQLGRTIYFTIDSDSHSNISPQIWDCCLRLIKTETFIRLKNCTEGATNQPIEHFLEFLKIWFSWRFHILSWYYIERSLLTGWVPCRSR